MLTLRHMVATLCFLNVPAAALADARTIDGEVPASFANITAAKTLTQSEREIDHCDNDGNCTRRTSDLRVGYIVESLGTGTDLSPTQEIWLTMFNDIQEAATVSAQWRVTTAYDLYGARRVSAGIYEFYVLDYASSGGGCIKSRVTLQVDAQAASAAVRRGEGEGRFDVLTYAGPVTVGETARICVDE